ncbi:hypothetical protein ABTD55_20120, partial [Acinetobacter baumannii]
LLEGLFLFGEIKVRMSRLLLATTAGLMALNTKLSVLSALVASCGHASPLSCKANTVKSKPNKLSQKKKRLIARRLNKHK